jgi:cell division protein FtsI/penicillin-binding protein 2
LRIGERSLDCSHPPLDPMDARQALAWSCNSYFAAVGATLAPGELHGLLATTGLLAQTGLAVGAQGGEATADFREPQNTDQAKLALLGVDGIRVTPLELASAYRWLAMQLAEHGGSAAAEVVRLGLQDSASFGMAGAASLGGVPIAGKTGTANLGPGTGSHGWFVGLAPSEHPTVVLVVYLPAGRGADAAQVTARVLANSPLKTTPSSERR